MNRSIPARWLVALFLFISVSPSLAAAPQTLDFWSKPSGKLVLVQDGVSRMPIVLAPDLPPLTREAAMELAKYIQRISGGEPEIIIGTPDPLPTSAIWIGDQPALSRVFHDLDRSFTHPEEILVVANDQHLFIAGRDDWSPETLTFEHRRKTVTGRQHEYGTVNAIYTFIQEGLGVRWLWPGELGEDIPRQTTIALDQMTYRYHPTIRGRSGLLRYSRLARGGHSVSPQWKRRQRLQLDSLDLEGGHAFTDWWDRFNKSHPEYFALQPDGTRSGFPRGRTTKLCLSNPAVWQQWLADVEAKLVANPGQSVFSAAPNDSWASGHCICKNCQAWDHPDGELRIFNWEGLGQDYVALSDRHVTFANQCAQLLKERYPDKDYYVLMASYGHSRPAPIKAKPADNVIIFSVANFLFNPELADRGSPSGVTYLQQFNDWAKLKPKLVFRPNISSIAGWHQGLPDVPLTQAIADIKHVASQGAIGIYIDSVWEHWATQGPLYYVMGQLVWNPQLDGQQVLDDYYARGFGPAGGTIRDYWQFMEKTRENAVDQKQSIWDAYDQTFFTNATKLLQTARLEAENADPVYAQRIAFVEVGLKWTQMVDELHEVCQLLQKPGQPVEELKVREKPFGKKWTRWPKIRWPLTGAPLSGTPVA